MDTGASIAPYNHFELARARLRFHRVNRIANEYIWGRQIGENTINP